VAEHKVIVNAVFQLSVSEFLHVATSNA